MRCEKAAVSVIALIVFGLVLLAAAPSAKAQSASELKLNFIASDQKMMIYSCADRQLKIGQKMSVIRGGETIGTIEITEVKPKYCIAKTVDKKKDFQEMDTVVILTGAASTAAPAASAAPAAAPAASAPAASAPATASAPAAAPAAAAADAKPAAASTSSSTSSGGSSRRRSRADGSSSSSSTEAAPAASAETAAASTDSASSSRKSRRGGSSSSSSTDTSTDESAASAEAAPAEGEKKESPKSGSKKGEKKPADPRAYAFPTTYGATGLWTVPTANLQSKGTGAVSGYWGKYTTSGSYFQTEDFYKNYHENSELTIKNYGAAYGLTDVAELYIARYDRRLDALGYDMGGYVVIREDVKTNRIGVKYAPGKRIGLKKDTHKQWKYVVGAERFKADQTKGSRFYAVATLPYNKFNFHAGVFQMNYNGVAGKRIGSMGGVEFVVTPRLEMIGEVNLFQSDYEYNMALRYVVADQGAVLLGVRDITHTQMKSFGFSYSFN